MNAYGKKSNWQDACMLFLEHCDSGLIFALLLMGTSARSPEKKTGMLCMLLKT